MLSMNTPSGLEPKIEFFFNAVGQTVAACVTGHVGDFRPDENRAILDTPRVEYVEKFSASL